MSETINGIDTYVSTIDGTATQYIRVAVVNTQDVANFDTWETAAGSVAGTQLVDFGGTAATGSATGLANDATAYTASVSIDGTAYPVSVVGSAAQTFGALVTEINADLPNTECAISSDDLLFTSTTTTNASKISITDTDLFSSLTGFVAINAAVDGDLETYLASQTLTNGANAASAYLPAVETFDSGSPRNIIASDYTVGDLNVTFSDTEVEAELAAIKVKLDALQDLV